LAKKTKPISQGEAESRIARALKRQFYVPTFRSICIEETTDGMVRVRFSVPSHSRILREKLQPFFRPQDQFGVKAVSGAGHFEVRATSLKAIVKAIEKAWPDKQ